MSHRIDGVATEIGDSNPSKDVVDVARAPGVRGRDVFAEIGELIVAAEQKCSKPHLQKWWVDDCGRLAVRKQVFIGTMALEITPQGHSPKKLAGILFKRLGNANALPRRRGGKANADSKDRDVHYWDAGTVETWLSDRGASPEADDIPPLLD